MSRRLYGKATTPKAAQPARALPGTTCSTLAGYQAQSQLGSPTGALLNHQARMTCKVPPSERVLRSPRGPKNAHCDGRLGC
jgi:hypothetical protein